MIALRRAQDRHHNRRHKLEVFHTFCRESREGALADGFGALELLDEDHIPPGAKVPRPSIAEAELITYVREGSLAQVDSTGHTVIVRASEFQHLTTGRRIRHDERNASEVYWAHVFRIALHPTALGLDCSQEQRRFPLADRRGVLCIVASPDGRKGSLRVLRDALIYSAVLDVGQHLVHELAPGRNAWLHLVQGEVMLGDGVITTGDGAGVSAERAVSLTAKESSELLLIDLGAIWQGSQPNGGAL